MTYHAVARLRRITQAAFLALFCLLLLRTGLKGAGEAAATDAELGYPVRLFFELDPLAALCNALASHALYRGLAWSLVVLVPTLFLGRFFCGWICPLGALNQFFGSWTAEGKLGRRQVESNRYKSWQTIKYVVLLAGLVAAAFGSGVLGWLDPFSLLVRSLGLSIFPAANYAANAVLHVLEGVPLIGEAAKLAHAVLAATVLDFRQPYFRQGVYVGLVFVAILAVNLRVTRFWCRALCPLGALLAVSSRWSVFGLAKDAGKCDDCNACLMLCQGGDEPVGSAPWHKAECLLCLNCLDACPKGALSFGFFADTPAVDGPNLGRRKALVGLAAGAAAVPMLRGATGFAADRHDRLLRPPGALDEGDFLARCIRCGECMKVCPNNALQPGSLDHGLEGLWTPVLVPHIGYCEPSCVLCSQVCPTGAIWRITAAEKGWVVGVGDAVPVRLGTAFYDRGRCLPWAMGIECIVCQEWCPTSPKAIRLETAEALDPAGTRKLVRQPIIDPSHCVGCGACEFACVLSDRPAVYVTSIGESRSSANQLLLTQGERRPT